MASLKELRNRIASVQATQKITRAMQMVAASKLRRAQEAAEAARPYADRMGAVLGNLAVSINDVETAPKLLAGTGSDKRHLLIVATAERGLCGGFNSSIARLAREDAQKLMAAGVPCELSVYPGACHAFQRIEQAGLSKRYRADFLAALRKGLGC